MKTTIIGGGVIGLFSAYYLQKTGWKVTIIDQGPMDDGCSYGNLGMIVPSHFVPLAAPGMVSQGLKWMLNSRSPLYIKPSLSPSLLSWGWQFMKKANQAHVNNSAKPLRDLNLWSKSLYEELAKQPEFSFGLDKKGILMYFKTPKVEEEEAHLAETAQGLGINAEVLNLDSLRKLEPNLDLDVIGAVHYHSDAHLQPHVLLAQLKEYLKNNGVQIIENCTIEKFDLKKGQITAILTDKGQLDSDLFILAAGSWLPEIGKLVGENISLMPGKGYTMNYKWADFPMNIPSILCEARVAITPMGEHIRVGGTMEIAPINSTINMGRVEAIVESVPRYFKGINLPLPATSQIWYGFRPCSPDGLPYIGISKKTKNLVIAGGHAMSGLSLGPATGKLVSELAQNETLSIDNHAFRIERFR